MNEIEIYKQCRDKMNNGLELSKEFEKTITKSLNNFFEFF